MSRISDGPGSAHSGASEAAHVSRSGGTVWRGIVLPVADKQALERGEAIPMKPRPFECWSRNPIPALKILRIRAEKRERSESYCAILLRREVNPDEIGIDVAATGRAMGLDPSNDVRRRNYGAREEEVILRRPQGPFFIHPDHVEEIMPLNGDQHWAPRPGETFHDHSLEYNEMSEFEELMGRDNCGCMAVRKADTIYPLVFLSGQWVTGGAPYPVEEWENRRYVKEDTAVLEM